MSRGTNLNMLNLWHAMRMSGKASRMFYHKTSSCSLRLGISSQSDHVTELSLLKQSVSRPANLIPGQ